MGCKEMHAKRKKQEQEEKNKQLEEEAKKKREQEDKNAKELTFELGDTGLWLDTTSGKVKYVQDEGSGAELGVLCDWSIKKINNSPYAPELLDLDSEGLWTVK